MKDGKNVIKEKYLMLIIIASCQIVMGIIAFIIINNCTVMNNYRNTIDIKNAILIASAYIG